MKNEEGILTPQELADKLKVTLSWIRQKARPGVKNGFPVIRLGRYTRFRLSDVLKWLEAQQENDDSNSPLGDI